MTTNNTERTVKGGMLNRLIQRRYVFFIYVMMCFTFISFCIILLQGCSSDSDIEKSTRSKVAIQAADSSHTHVKKRSPESLLKLKQKIITKRKNPILTTAQNNTLFNAQKWLKSDYAFSKRYNQKQISDYDHIIKKMARRYGFDWRFIAAQIYAESNFKTEAKSHVGAMGLMQIMPSTAKFMGFNPKSVVKPEINIAVGCMYNQRMYNLWGKQIKDYNRLAFALASYNAGRGRVLKSYSTKESRTSWEKVHLLLPEETQSYVHKIYLKHDHYKRYILP